MMKHQNSKDLLAYWEKIRGNAAAPDRREVNPRDIPALLPYVFILDLTPARPSFRLAGTAMCSSHMRELKAVPFADTWAVEDRRQIEIIMDSVGNDTVGAAIGSTASNGMETISFETLLLPLRENGGHESRLIGVQSHFGRPWSLNGFAADRHSLVSMRILSPVGQDGELTGGNETPVIDFSGRGRGAGIGGRRVRHLTVMDGGASV